MMTNDYSQVTWVPSIIDKPKVTLVETIGRCPLCQSLAFRTRDCGMCLVTGCYQVCYYSRGVLKIAKWWDSDDPSRGSKNLISVLMKTATDVNLDFWNHAGLEIGFTKRDYLKISFILFTIVIKYKNRLDEWKRDWLLT